MESLVARFLGFGADTVCTDPSRIFRLGGSLNSKAVPAEHVRCIYPEVGQPCTYQFDDLCRVVLPYERPEGRKRASGQVGSSAQDRPSMRVLRDLDAGSAAQLWTDRVADLQTLLDLRWFGGLPPRHRDVFLFLCACALSWLVPPISLRREMCELARRTRAQWTTLR